MNWSITPKDFANLKAVGKTAADMTATQRALSRGKNFLRTSVRDVRGMRRASRLQVGKVNDFAKRKVAAEIGYLGARDQLRADSQSTLGWPGVGTRLGNGKNWAQARSVVTKEMRGHDLTLQNMKKAEGRWQGNQKRFGLRTAALVGAGVLGTGVAIKGVQTYKKWRRQAKENTKFRGYDVHPEHQYAAVGEQPYNQAYYNEELIERIIAANSRRAYLL